MKNGDTIFSLFLESLGVPHTPEYLSLIHI